MIKQEQKEKNDPISFLAIHSSTWMNEERERSPFKHRNLHRLFFFSQLLTLIYLLSAEKKQKSWMLGTFSCQVFLLADKLFFFFLFFTSTFFCTPTNILSISSLPKWLSPAPPFTNFYSFDGIIILEFLYICRLLHLFLTCADVMHTVFLNTKPGVY